MTTVAQTKQPTVKKRVLLLDIENQPKMSKEKLFEELKSPHLATAIIVYAKLNLNFSMDELSTIHKNAAKIQIIKMSKISKNSADFGLAFHMGRLSLTYKPHEVEFVIISDDADLEHPINMLKQLGYSVRRHSKPNPNKPATPLANQNKLAAPLANTKTHAIQVNQKISS